VRSFSAITAANWAPASHSVATLATGGAAHREADILVVLGRAALRPDAAEGLHQVLDGAIEVSRAPAHELEPAAPRDLPVHALAGPTHDRDERAHASAVANRGGLGHERAERDPDDVCSILGCQARDQRARVVGEILEGVRRLGAPREHREGTRSLPRARRGPPDVPVVVADDAEAAANKLVAEVVPPPDELEAHAHDQKDQGIPRIPQLVDAELDFARYLNHSLCQGPHSITTHPTREADRMFGS
jgi:hypothetical protein